MMKTLKTNRSRLLAGLLLLVGLAADRAPADEGPPPPPIPRTQGLAQYSSQVNAVLPSFSSSMLTVPNGTDWMAGKTVHQVAVAVLDSDPGAIRTSGAIVEGYDPPDGPRRIKLDFAEGYIRYTNRERSFGATSPCAVVSATEAENALLSTVSSLELPASEWSARRVDTVVDRSVDGEGQDPTPETVCEIERMVTMTRKAPNGLPVFDSRVRETVSNLHQRARLLIDWPKFALEMGLLMRTRAEVVDDLARQIWDAQRDANGMGAEVDLEIELGYAKLAEGYVPVARAMFADIYDRYAGEVLYVPLALNPASGADPEEVLATLEFRVKVDALGGSVLMEFGLPESETVRLAVMDVNGREVAVLAQDSFAQGWHQVSWNLQDSRQRRVPSGVYFARLETARAAPVRKLIVVR